MRLDTIIKTTVEAVPGLAGKVYPHTALKDVPPPFAFYLQEAEDEVETLDGGSGLLSADYQVHLVTSTNAAMQMTGSAIMAALQALQNTEHSNMFIGRAVCRQNQPDIYEQEVRLYRKPLYLHLDYQEV